MKLTFAASDSKLGPDDQRKLTSELGPIEALLADETRAHLHVVVAEERHGASRVSMSLDMPKRFLFATETARAPSSAFRLACETLIRKLSRYRERRERARAHGRRPRREEEAPLVDAAARGDVAGFRSNITRHLDRLRAFIKWELHHDERTTKGVRSRISVDDMAENVLTDLFETYQREAPALPAEQWMIRRALERLDVRIRESMREPREQQPAQGEPDTPMPEEFLDEYERLKDMFPDIYGSGEPTPMDRLAAGAEASPARGMEAEELKGALAAALGALPPDWRRTFALHFVDGYGPPEIADVLHTSEDQVIQDLETTLSFLRARLR